VKKTLNHTSGVTLQQRPLKNGRVSLYLHVHRKGCKPERVWLKLYLTGNKFADKRTLAIADEARRQKHLEMQMSDAAKPNTNDELLAYMLHRASLRRNPKSYHNTIRQLKLFTGKETIGFEELTRTFVDDFSAYLTTKTKLSQNSAATYWQVLNAVLNEAARERRIPFNPCTLTRGIKQVPSRRQFLTFEELQLLAYTPCKNEEVKRAFLFSAWTGLRLSDVKNLRWLNVEALPSGEPAIVYTQQKTGVIDYKPLSDTALALINDGKQHAPTERLFTLPCDQYIGKTLAAWGKEAGLTKHVHFHLARHSFATLALAQGADLYTVSALLGHSSIKHTQVYAKVVNSSKTKAVNALPSLKFSPTQITLDAV
jgi:integrase